MKVLIHYLKGTSVDVVTLEGVGAKQANETIDNFGKLRGADGVFTFSTPDGGRGAIPAQNVQLIEVKP